MTNDPDLTITQLVRRARLVRRCFRFDTNAEISSETAALADRLRPLWLTKTDEDGYYLDLFKPNPFETDPEEIARQYSLETQTLVWFKMNCPDFDEAQMIRNSLMHSVGFRLTPEERATLRQRTHSDAAGLAKDGLLPSERREYEKLSTAEKGRFEMPISAETIEFNTHLTAKKKARFLSDYDAGLLEDGDVNHSKLVRYRHRWRRDHLVSACGFIEDIADWIDTQERLPVRERDKDLAMLQQRYPLVSFPKDISKRATNRKSAWLAISIVTAEQTSVGRADHEPRPDFARNALKAFGTYEKAKARAMQANAWHLAESRKSHNILISNHFYLSN